MPQNALARNRGGGEPAGAVILLRQVRPDQAREIQ
jgi:hypothetical protein